jgi:tetratricopeptide (TPR) repeat protein
LEYYEQAVSADPNYALAYAELADLYSVVSQAAIIDPKEGTPKAVAAAQKAIQLDVDLGEGHTAMGFIKLNSWDWNAAEREFRRAIELNPNIARAHDGFAQYLSYMLRHEEAIVEGRRAYELSPLALYIQRNFGAMFLNARRYDEAIEVFRKVLELDPNYSGAHAYLGYAYAAKNMDREAIAFYEESIRLGLNTTSNQIYLGASYARMGDRAHALELLKNLEESKEYVSPGEFAVLYTALGDREKAFASLERAYRDHDLQLKFLTTEPWYDDLRNDTRFTDLVRRVGLPS